MFGRYANTETSKLGHTASVLHNSTEVTGLTMGHGLAPGMFVRIDSDTDPQLGESFGVAAVNDTGDSIELNSPYKGTR